MSDAKHAEKRDGVLPHHELLALVKEKRIVVPDVEKHIQPNSVDLPLGQRCWRMRSIRAPRANETVAQVIAELAIDEFDLTKPHILERSAIYIAEIDVQVALPTDIRAAVDSKSSTGRCDIQTRLLADHVDRYDRLPDGYAGKLYTFISTNSFLVRVARGISLNQMHLARGNPVLADKEALALIAEHKLLFDNGKPVPTSEVRANDGITLRLDLHKSIAGYRARSTNEVLDLTHTNNSAATFWEVIPGPVGSITLEKGEFYILSTLEAIRIPPTHTAWIPPFRPEFGEFRSHYAGFYDAGFGYGTGELEGATTTLEVRSQDNSLTLLHGTPVVPVLLVKLTDAAREMYGTARKSSYQSQSGPKLAKYFS